MVDKNKQVATRQEGAVSTNVVARRGFENEQDGDLILPRAKVLQPTSDELTNERYMEQNLKAGMMVNSLTKETLPESFIPVFKFNSRVLWVPKNIGGGMSCRSLDGITGQVLDSEKWGPYDQTNKIFNIAKQVANGTVLQCAGCPYSKWVGEVPPACMPSMNFFALFEGQAFPLVLPFKSTSMKYGKKLYSMAKMMPGDMFEYKYRIKAYRKTNEKGTFYETDIFPAGKATTDEITVAEQMYNAFRDMAVKFDENDGDEGAAAAGFANSLTDEM